MRFVVTDNIFETFPDMRIGVLVARGIQNPRGVEKLSDALEAAQETVRAALAGTNVTDHPRIHCWREAYRSFGAKPKKYPSSIENLVSRLESTVESLDAFSDRLEHALSLHQLRAPVAGRIGDLVTLKVSEVVSAGQHLGTIIPSGDVHVVAEFAPHRALGRIRSGQRAKLRLEGFSWVQYGAVPATVSRVGSEPSGGTIRVELRLDDPEAFPVDLGHGLPGILEVEVERISPAELVLRAAGNTLSSPVLSGVR